MLLPTRGDRIRLVFTDDPYTQLKPDDEGTVTSVSQIGPNTQVGVRWDSGSSLALLSDKDRWEVI